MVCRKSVGMIWKMSGDGTEVSMRKEDQLFLGGEYVCLRCGDLEHLQDKEKFLEWRKFEVDVNVLKPRFAAEVMPVLNHDVRYVRLLDWEVHIEFLQLPADWRARPSYRLLQELKYFVRWNLLEIVKIQRNHTKMSWGRGKSGGVRVWELRPRECGYVG